MRTYKILSGSWLKIIAMVSMVADHYAMLFLTRDAQAHIPYFTIGNYAIDDYFILRNIIGRMAFPIFAFLLVEGYRHTKSKKKYGINLLIFAVLSIIPWNLMHGRLLYFRSVNVLFTLLFGLIGMMISDEYNKAQNSSAKAKYAACMVTLIIIARFCRLDYGIAGIGYIILLHLFDNNRLGQFVATIAAFSSRKFHQLNFLAFIPIMLYNGERGFIKGNWGKYAMYAFYPLHMLVLWILKWI